MYKKVQTQIKIYNLFTMKVLIFVTVIKTVLTLVSFTGQLTIMFSVKLCLMKRWLINFNKWHMCCWNFLRLIL